MNTYTKQELASIANIRMAEIKHAVRVTGVEELQALKDLDPADEVWFVVFDADDCTVDLMAEDSISLFYSAPFGTLLIEYQVVYAVTYSNMVEALLNSIDSLTSYYPDFSLAATTEFFSKQLLQVEDKIAIAAGLKAGKPKPLARSLRGSIFKAVELLQATNSCVQRDCGGTWFFNYCRAVQLAYGSGVSGLTDINNGLIELKNKALIDVLDAVFFGTLTETETIYVTQNDLSYTSCISDLQKSADEFAENVLLKLVRETPLMDQGSREHLYASAFDHAVKKAIRTLE